jgi:hypothetical protein
LRGNAQQRGFSGTVRANQCYEFARRDGESDSAERETHAEALFDRRK